MNTVIIAHWKRTGVFEAYKSVVGFQRLHPQFNLATLKYHITRKKQAYDKPELTLTKIKITKEE